MDRFVGWAAQRLRPRAMRGGIAILCACVAACSHLDPSEHTGRAHPNDPRRVMPPTVIAQPDQRQQQYVSTLHAELERVDEHRVRMQAIIGQIGSERDFYTAALWLAVPMVAFSPAPKDVAKALAVLGAGYAFLNTRPKQQVPTLQDTVGQLTCLMVKYSPYLYTTQDFGRFGVDGLHSERYDNLVDATAHFEKQSARFIRAVPVIVPKDGGVNCAEHGTDDCAVREKLRRQRSRSGNVSTISDYTTYVARRIDDANRELDALALVEDAILRTAPFELSARAHLVIASAAQRLEAMRPRLVAPDAVITPGGKESAGGAAPAQSRTRVSHFEAQAPMLRGLSKENRELRDDADDADRDLSEALRKARAFMTAHEGRLARATILQADYCAAYGARQAAAVAAPPGTPASIEFRLGD